MLVFRDTREKTPWTFEGQGITTTTATLETGDYSLPGLEHKVTIERKSLDDWVGTVMRERSRFYRELDRMRALQFRCVIIEASVREIMAERYTSQVKAKSVLGFIADVAVAQSVPVYLGGTRAESQVLAGAFLRAASTKLTR
tara:strand:- start:16715 stop:17140 length:426 start_codon:yes stop_codon:yes gene_type:complete